MVAIQQTDDLTSPSYQWVSMTAVFDLYLSTHLSKSDGSLGGPIRFSRSLDGKARKIGLDGLAHGLANRTEEDEHTVDHLIRYDDVGKENRSQQESSRVNRQSIFFVISYYKTRGFADGAKQNYCR